jgi:uracil-DNA glycosylase
VFEEARACTICASSLPLGPNPTLRGKESARLLIVGQAPGLKVHQTSLPWNDPSGDRLRIWMGISRETFYDESRIAIVPMGLCYPGRNDRGGDLPPRKECAPLWHPRIRPFLKSLKLTLLVGSYAQQYYLKGRLGSSLSDTVRRWEEYLPTFLPLPHPSFRNLRWFADNPWFEETVVPELKKRVGNLLK